MERCPFWLLSCRAAAEVLLQSTCATEECAYEVPAAARETVPCGQASEGWAVWEPNLFKQGRKRALSPSY